MIPVTYPALLLLQATGGTSGTGLLIEIAAFVAIGYFLLIRPQQQQRKKHEERQQTLKKGDGVVTAGGIVGEVVYVKESTQDGKPKKSLDDLITIKSGDTRLVVERRSIARVAGAAEPPASSAS